MARHLAATVDRQPYSAAHIACYQVDRLDPLLMQTEQDAFETLRAEINAAQLVPAQDRGRGRL